MAGREDQADRFFYYDKRLSAGFQVHFGGGATLDVGGGYAFDRFYFQGRTYSDRNHDRVDVGNGPFPAIRLGLRY